MCMALGAYIFFTDQDPGEKTVPAPRNHSDQMK